MKNKLTPAAAIIELNRLKDNSVVSDPDRRNAAVDMGIRAIRAHFDNREVLYTDDNGVDRSEHRRSGNVRRQSRLPKDDLLDRRGGA